jgi:hypothetical protein
MALLPRAILVGAITLVNAASAYAVELIVNGGFETGSAAGWSPAAQAGSGGNIAVALNNGAPLPGIGSTSPFAINPTGGNYFAVTVQTRPGSYVLTQTFTVPSSMSMIAYSFDLVARN